MSRRNGFNEFESQLTWRTDAHSTSWFWSRSAAWFRLRARLSYGWCRESFPFGSQWEMPGRRERIWNRRRAGWASKRSPWATSRPGTKFVEACERNFITGFYHRVTSVSPQVIPQYFGFVLPRDARVCRTRMRFDAIVTWSHPTRTPNAVN